MDLGLDGKAAFIAGASSGLGYSIALELAREGCRVAICSRSKERIRKAAEDIAEETGGDVKSIVCDVTEESAVRNAVDEAAAEFGGLNALVTNAGGPPAGFVDDLSTEDWHSAIDLNLMSTINLCRAALPHLRASADSVARILMVTSISAKQPIPNLYLSNTARAGVQGFAKSLAEEVGRDGITVNTILPGYTRTDRLIELADSLQQETGKSLKEVEAVWAEAAALKRIAEPEELAAAAVFLLSARASYITGIGLPVDGGRSKHIL